MTDSCSREESLKTRLTLTDAIHRANGQSAPMVGRRGELPTIHGTLHGQRNPEAKSLLNCETQLKKKCTLLYGAEDETHNHAVVLRAFINRHQHRIMQWYGDAHLKHQPWNTGITRLSPVALRMEGRHVHRTVLPRVQPNRLPPMCDITAPEQGRSSRAIFANRRSAVASCFPITFGQWHEDE